MTTKETYTNGKTENDIDESIRRLKIAIYPTEYSSHYIDSSIATLLIAIAQELKEIRLAIEENNKYEQQD